MTILLYITSLAIFMWFFYAIGARYFGLIPFIIIVAIILISSKDYREKSISATQRQTYSIYMAWLAMLAGFIGIGSFFINNTVYIGLRIIAINIAFWIGSYMFSYRDGSYMGQLGYYAAIVYTLWQSSYILDGSGLWQSISLFRLLTLGLLGFIIGVIGHWKPVPTYMWYKLFLLTGGAILIAISNYIGDIYSILLIDSVLILGLSIAMYWIHSYHIPTTHEIKTISIRRILAGEKINKNKQIPQSNSILHKLSKFINQMPLRSRYTIEATNCAIVIITIGLYLTNIGQAVSYRHQWIYRIIIGLFIATALVLKRIGFSSVMQKITLFAVINYAIYLTLYTIFDGSIGAIAGWGIVWNILSSIMLFYAPSSFLADILKQADYWYWIVMTIVALCINLYLLGLSALPGQLIFSLIFVYIGLQGILLYYGIKHIQQVD